MGTIANNLMELRKRLTGEEYTPVSERAEYHLLHALGGRALTTARQITDMRGPQIPESLSMKDILNAGVTQKAVNLLTGARISNIDTVQSLDREAGEALRKALRKAPHVRVFEQPYIPDEDKHLIDPGTQYLMGLLKGLDEKRRKADRAKKKVQQQ